jgi:lipopolysaccharide transport system permease protein
MDNASARFLWQYAASQVRLKYRYTLLGFVWNFLEPALFLAVLSSIFSIINRMDISDYAVFLFGGLVPWKFFENAVHGVMASIVDGAWLSKKMKVNFLTFPVSRWIIAIIEFSFSFLVMLLLFLFIKKTWTVHILVLPLSVLPWLIAALGVGLVCATAYTFFRDIRPVVSMVLMFAFFSSPILFTASIFPPGSIQARWLVYHPVTYFAALMQKPIYYGTWPGGTDWVVSCSFAAGVLALGWILLSRQSRKFYFYL